MAYNSKYTGQQVEEILDHAVTATEDASVELPDDSTTYATKAYVNNVVGNIESLLEALL